MTSLYKILKSAKLGAGAAQDFHTAIMAQKMPFAKRSGAEHEYTGAVPVTFTANGQPLLDYLISGNTVQSGTPTPDNPIMPQGCGDITANMLSVYKENCSINANGEEMYNNVAMIYKANVIVSGSTFTLNFGGLSVGDVVRIHAYAGDIWKEQIAAISITQVPFAFTVASEVDNIRISIRMTATDVTLTDGQYKIPISSASTTTPVYLGDVETTRKIRKSVFNGTEEDWEKSATSTRGGCFVLKGFGTGVTEKAMYCTHATYVSTASQLASNNTCYIGNDFNIWLDLFNAQTTIEQFKTYLQQQYAAGTPVIVWYVLETPETAVVNEPLIKIGDYADTISHAQAGVSIPTANGSTTLDVETAVKPSEIYIKYKS